MKETYSGGQTSATGGWRFFVHESLPLERETGYFILASALDLMLTWLMLSYEGHTRFVESNVVAQYFLYSWGLRGLAGFKFGTVAFVAVLCQVIARKRLEIARRLLVFATIAATAVVLYSAVLLVRHS